MSPLIDRATLREMEHALHRVEIARRDMQAVEEASRDAPEGCRILLRGNPAVAAIPWPPVLAFFRARLAAAEAAARQMGVDPA